jgi:protein-disulfide isomerase
VRLAVRLRRWPLWPAIAILGCVEPGAPARPTVEVRLPADGPWIGRADAPLTLIEFGSHGCAGCWRFTLEGLPRLTREFIEPGALRYRYVDVSASPLAALVECRAAERGLPAARTALYRYLQDTVGEPADSGILAVPPECLTDSAAQARRRLEANLARRLGVPGTPTFLVGRSHPDGRVVGWVELGFTNADSLASVVRAALQLVGDQ